MRDSIVALHVFVHVFFESEAFMRTLQENAECVNSTQTSDLDISCNKWWKLGLWPSLILNKKLCLFSDLKAGTLDLSLQHWTCLWEARPKNLCLSWTWKLGIDLVTPALDLSF